MPTSAASAGTSVKQKDIARYGDLYDFSNLVDRLRFSTPPRLSRYYIVISHTVCGTPLAAAMNFHMYFTVFNSSAHNYCPVLLIITQKCNSNVLYLHITMSYE